MKSPKNKVAQAEPILLKMLRDPNRFKKLEDGWIRDSLLGVEWGPTSAEEMTWTQAKAYCKKLGGRLPEVNELQSIVDYRKVGPAVFDVFADTKSSWYWSGTPYAGHSGSAWFVGFYNGSVDYYFKDGNGYVRPVRSSQ